MCNPDGGLRPRGALESPFPIARHLADQVGRRSQQPGQCRPFARRLLSPAAAEILPAAGNMVRRPPQSVAARLAARARQARMVAQSRRSC